MSSSRYDEEEFLSSRTQLKNLIKNVLTLYSWKLKLNFPLYQLPKEKSINPNKNPNLKGDEMEIIQMNPIIKI